MLIPPQHEASGAARVEAIGYSKRFGAFQALADVSLTVRAGSIHALLGENGAGKSTFVKSLIGFYKPDNGTTMIDGREHAIDSPRAAAALGIGMIFQHFTVAPGMTVAENLTLADRDARGVIDWKAQRARLDAFMRTAPFPLPLDRPVAELAAGEKQKLEILKQLHARQRFLILDEPTSVLTPLEADEVLGQLRALADAGQLSILMITHKFREVFAYCDEVTVLRRGRHAGHAKVSDVSRDELAGWMMGAADAGSTAAGGQTPAAVTVTAASAATATTTTPARLSLQGLEVDGDDGRAALHGLTLSVLPGEIVGVAGVSGNGQRELMAALTGVLPVRAGRVQVDGQDYRPGRGQTHALRVSSLPEEPLHNACVGKLTVEENLALRNYDRAPLSRARWWLSRRAMRAQAVQRIADYKVKTQGPSAPIESLSGGNVQRAVLAREFSEDPRLLIVANPCFGLDFQATAEIHARLREARARGAGVLLISEDLDELLALSDRLLVLSHGAIGLELPLAPGVQPDSAVIAAIGRAMAGDAAQPQTEEAAA